ncbi:MAG: hypothetical protein CSA72_11340 [Rhodobacterales bacterium]|nr:MAG: hypothetical protein CSA72_11340 [Rhodobacterales bacterium]
MTRTNIFIAAAVASLTAGAAVAQDAFVNQDRTTDAIENIEENIQDSYDRDVATFGNAGRALGWSGSLSASTSMTSGNTDNVDVAAGMRLNHFDGKNGHRIALAYGFSDKDDTTTKDELLFGYDYTREIGSNLYAFGKTTVAYDKFDTYKYDAFLGAGVGYRIVNTGKTQWSIQGGPGYRYAEDNAGNAVIEEAAVSLSSYYSNKLTPTVFLTNDTDVLWSETDTAVKNELGVNVAMTDALALRTSLTTEYKDNPAPGYKHTDNTLGMSVVYSFN